MGLILGIPLAILGAALLVGGIVGYRKFNSSPAKVISAAAAAAGLAIWLIILFITPVFQSSPDSPGPSISYSSKAGNYETLVSRLSAEGVKVEQGDDITQPFFSVPGKTATINGDELQVYEYLSEKTVEEESATVSSTGSSIGPNMVSWIKPPHFYRSGKIIVIYLGTNADTMNFLEDILGKQFAGSEAPAPAPPITGGGTPLDPGEPEPITPLQIEVAIEGSGFNPANLPAQPPLPGSLPPNAPVPAPAPNLPVGTTIVWYNNDSVDHTVTARDNSFDSGKISPNETFEYTFEQPGDFEYYCKIHPSMVGKITIE